MKIDISRNLRTAELCMYGALVLAGLGVGIQANAYLDDYVPRQMIMKQKYEPTKGYDIRIGKAPKSILMVIGKADFSDSTRHPYGDFTKQPYILAEDTDANGTIDTFTVHGTAEGKLRELTSKERLSALEKSIIQEK